MIVQTGPAVHGRDAVRERPLVKRISRLAGGFATADAFFLGGLG